jgi:hypothetical protein
MKFLCVSCDESMKLIEVPPADRGSLSVLYRCPDCAHEIAMLTNPAETQVVGSLGIDIRAGGESAESESKCPFASMVQEAGSDADDASTGLQWSEDARTRLDDLPEFARPLARDGVEKFARERGLDRVDTDVLDDARRSLGM